MGLPENEWYIKAPWGRICIIAWGDCRNPPVLLCHGAMDTAVSFRPLVQMLPSKFYYIAMELPGSGKSDRFPQGLMISVYDMVYSIGAVAKHFRWETFACIAHSLGALTVRTYNVTNPGMISKLVELDPINFFAVEPEYFQLWYEKNFVKFYNNYEKYNTPKGKAPKLKWKDAVEKVSKLRDIPEEVTAAILERMSEPAGNGNIRYTFDLRIEIITSVPFSSDHVRKIFTNLTTPTLMITTESSLKNGLFRNTKFLLDEKNYPHNNFRMRSVAGSHNVHVSKPTAVAGYVGQFLLHGGTDFILPKMALFMKQDFAPPILSKRWLLTKFRPNMVIYNHHHIISILESGLLFREDSVEVEQEASSPEEVWRTAGGTKGGWLTRGEALTSAAAIGACVCLFPPRSFNRTSLINLATYISLPVALRASHRARCKGSLSNLLVTMRDYLALARRSAACLKEYAALHAQIGSLSSVIESTHTLLCRQQSELCVLMSRASSALLGNAPWLRADVCWEVMERDNSDGLMKIHHAFLVVQSTLLKHIAMAHFIPSIHAQKLYKNYNERIFWLHNVLICHLNDIFRENFEALERMYRLLKNSGNKSGENSKKLGNAVNDSWVYSEVHTSVAKACLEMKLALNKCTGLDMFLDSCALNKEEIDVNILYKDLDDLVENLTNCLSSVQKAQLRLKKINNKVTVSIKHDSDEDGGLTVAEQVSLLKIVDREPETKDEVFYLVKTDDDIEVVQPVDVTTAPGKKEKENTKMVLCELKRKLGKREDVMRERERQALIKTMPELKCVPEFERQIKLEEFVDKRGYITKLKRSPLKQRLFKNYNISKKKCSISKKLKKIELKINKYKNKCDFNNNVSYEANTKFNFKSKLLTFEVTKRNLGIIMWCKVEARKRDSFSDFSDGLSDVEAGTANKNVNEVYNNEKYRFSKRDLEFTSLSDSDESYHVLNDVRKHRVIRKKNHPSRQAYNLNNRGVDVDESMKPIEYSFGTGLSMASILQINNNARLPNMAAEEVFIGDGEVSSDSGNDF
ncbi:hypothetical protein K1T71_014458 [Dendrolimus kikuchii]|uniref:Uncharacterized protein n=1 Tax=Dendrolimus kikuchii TaxID=765133 RepID=A0ACC1CEF7_9NEOP|nr:hypothetical protein K1T71_014458 [Dendrolimus kikuchii]